MFNTAFPKYLYAFSTYVNHYSESGECVPAMPFNAEIVECPTDRAVVQTSSLTRCTASHQCKICPLGFILA